MKPLLALLALVATVCIPLPGSARADELPPLVLRALKDAGVPLAAVAVVVREVESGTPLLGHNPRVAFNPASTMKLLTTFAALELLGPAYTWKTEALIGGKLDNGVLQGDLHLRGGGDPRLAYEQFGRLLRQLRDRGVRDIRGDLVLDRSLFAIGDDDPGRFDGQSTRPYNVAPDALLVNFKAITLRLIPDPTTASVLITSEPAPTNLDIVNQLRLGNGNRPGGNGCGDWRENLRADVFPHPQATRLVLTGTFPVACGEQSWNLSVMDHPQFVLGVFRQLWAELGGQFHGAVRTAAVPADARPLALLPSPSLAEVVRDINKFSNNVMARQLFLTLGVERNADNPRRPATTADGERALAGWLEARNLAIPELVLENGSGLSRRERIAADSLAKVLLAAWKSPVMPEFIASLPLTATDGTMRRRLATQGVAGRAHIKTGSLEGVKSIAGYVLSRTGRRWVVVFLVNHAHANATQAAQDGLLQWVYDR